MHRQWEGPYLVVLRKVGGMYIIADMSSHILKDKIAAFRLIPYFVRQSLKIPANITKILDQSEESLKAIVEQPDNEDKDKLERLIYSENDEDEELPQVTPEEVEEEQGKDIEVAVNTSKLFDEQLAMLDEVVQAVGVANYLHLEIPSNLTVCDLGTIAKGVVGGLKGVPSKVNHLRMKWMASDSNWETVQVTLHSRRVFMSYERGNASPNDAATCYQQNHN
ncbi:hypothetical protein BDN70DRAFT_901398 [Pholiota conissans]|uniref:Uncharacterized protein n=1 Tax=Pholiota conissans TaxID=109636 RepID=A0A9P6CRQ6_9AGAR|nr:hypothetical protein BDN70DRAFT_901398 [Pholiota conissans]